MKIIFVPRADLTEVSASANIYEHDMNVFWANLHDIQDGEGMPYVDMFRNNQPVTLSGVTFARILEIINGYTVEYEDGQYQVNLIGANNNILDVRVQNQVSLNPSNSAGAIFVPFPSYDLGDIEDRLALVEKRIVEAL